MEKLSLLTKIEIPVIVGKVDIESMDFSTRPIKAARLVKRKVIGKNTRDAIFKRDEYACLRCGCKEDLTIDHIIPLGSAPSAPSWALPLPLGSYIIGSCLLSLLGPCLLPTYM